MFAILSPGLRIELYLDFYQCDNVSLCHNDPLSLVSSPAHLFSKTLLGLPRHRENRENREFESPFFQTGKTQGIC